MSKFKRLREWIDGTDQSQSVRWVPIQNCGHRDPGEIAARVTRELILTEIDRLLAEPEACGVLPTTDADGSVLFCEVVTYGEWSPERMPKSLRLRRTGDMGPGHVRDYKVVAEPEAAPTDAEVEAAMDRIANAAIAYDRSQPDSPREASAMAGKAKSFDALRALIARRVAAAKADDGLLAAAKECLDQLCDLTSGGDHLLCVQRLRDAIAAREAGGAQ